MFSLLYGFWEYIFRKEEFRILVVGIDKAGKTTLLEKLKSLYSGLPGLDPDKILPTVGLNVGRVEAHNSLLVFWDLGGQAGLRPIWDKYYSDSHGLVFTVDSSQPERFAEAKDALERALGSRDLFGAPILVFANKQDVPNAATKAEVTEYLGLGIFDTRPWRVQPTCAMSGAGMREGVDWLVTEIKRSQRALLLRQATYT